jgi:hypothetical protein
MVTTAVGTAHAQLKHGKWGISDYNQIQRANCDLQIPDSVVYFRKFCFRKVHTEETSDEGQGQENDGHDRELLHRLVLARGNGVENQIDQVV